MNVTLRTPRPSAGLSDQESENVPGFVAMTSRDKEASCGQIFYDFYWASGFLPSSPPAGSATANTLSGTYSVGTNGRTTSTVNNLSNNLIFYMVSGNSGYMLQADTGVDIGGAFAKQP